MTQLALLTPSLVQLETDVFTQKEKELKPLLMLRILQGVTSRVEEIKAMIEATASQARLSPSHLCLFNTGAVFLHRRWFGCLSSDSGRARFVCNTFCLSLVGHSLY